LLELDLGSLHNCDWKFMFVSLFSR